MAKPIKIWDGTIWQDIAIQAPSLNGYATTVDLTAHAIDTTGIHGISDTANLIVSTGSYADPLWITSLAKSKVGLGNVENTAISTWAGSTNITTIGNISTLILTTADTATAASHYFVETASDGIVRPKTLANVTTEIVTNTAIQTAVVSPTAAGSNGVRDITISTLTATGGADGDIWLVYV